MNACLSASLPLPPRPQGSMRAFRNRIVHKDQAALWKWRDQFCDLLEPHIPEGWDTSGPMRVTVTFVVPRPRGQWRKDGRVRSSAPFWPDRMPDLDKYIRAVGDALVQAGVMDDDGQIVAMHAVKRYALEGRINLEVTRMSDHPDEMYLTYNTRTDTWEYQADEGDNE